MWLNAFEAEVLHAYQAHEGHCGSAAEALDLSFAEVKQTLHALCRMLHLPHGFSRRLRLLAVKLKPYALPEGETLWKVCNLSRLRNPQFPPSPPTQRRRRP